MDQGEAYSFSRKIQGTLPSGWTIVSLLYSVRRAGTDPDGVAILQKTVTPGVIATDGTYPVTVNLTSANTALLVGAMVWDAKLVLTNGTITKQYTVAIGTIYAQGPLPAVGTQTPAVFTMAIATPATVTFVPLQLVLTMAAEGGAAINPLTRDVTWGSLDKTIVLVSPTGLLTAVNAGVADVVAICEGVEVRATVTVQAAVFSVTVTPNPLGVTLVAAAADGRREGREQCADGPDDHLYVERYERRDGDLFGRGDDGRHRQLHDHGDRGRHFSGCPRHLDRTLEASSNTQPVLIPAPSRAPEAPVATNADGTLTSKALSTSRETRTTSAPLGRLCSRGCRRITSRAPPISSNVQWDKLGGVTLTQGADPFGTSL